MLFKEVYLETFSVKCVSYIWDYYSSHISRGGR